MVSVKDVTPIAYLCPLTYSLMKDPVIDRDGNTFERAAIERWLETHDTSPLTKKPMFWRDLVPNRLLKNVIDEFMETNSDDTSNLSTRDIVRNRVRLIVMHHLHVGSLTDAQDSQIDAVFNGFNESDVTDINLNKAVKRCCWIGNAAFRFKVYQEVLQWIYPYIKFNDLPRLSPTLKQQAEDAFLWVVNNNPDSINMISVIHDVNQIVAQRSKREPHHNDQQIKEAQAKRWQ